MKTVRLSGDFYGDSFRSRPERFEISVVARCSNSRRKVLSSGNSPHQLFLHGYVVFLRRSVIAQCPNAIALARTGLCAVKPETRRILHLHLQIFTVEIRSRDNGYFNRNFYRKRHL